MGGVSTDSPPLDSVRKLSWSFRCETRICGENYSSDLYQAIRDEFLDARPAKTRNKHITNPALFN